MTGSYPNVVVQSNPDRPTVMFDQDRIYKGSKIFLRDSNKEIIESFEVFDIVPDIKRFSIETVAGLKWHDQLVCCLVRIPEDILLVGHTWWQTRFAISLKHRKPVLPELWEDEILRAEQNLVLQALVAYDADPQHSVLHARSENQADALYNSDGLIRLAGDLRLVQLIPCLRRIERWSGQIEPWTISFRRVAVHYFQTRRAAQIALRKLGQSPRYPCLQLRSKLEFKCDPESYATIRRNVLSIRPGVSLDEVLDKYGPPDSFGWDHNHFRFQYDVESDRPLSVMLMAKDDQSTIDRIKHYRPPLWSGPRIFSRAGDSIVGVNEYWGHDLDSKFLGSVTEVFSPDQKTLPISLDLVPSTVRQAAELLASSLSENDLECFRITPVETLVGNFGLSLRTGWSLWEETPLRYDAARHYGIAHPVDISSLIIHWARAMILDEPFFPQSHCVQYHEHWASLGKTSLEPGGWND